MKWLLISSLFTGGNGRLARIEKALDKVIAFVAGISGENGIGVRGTAAGSIVIYKSREEYVEPDSGFKIKASYDSQSKTFSGKVLGGSAKTLGGNVELYENYDFTGASDGDYVYLVYKNVDASYVEVGTWDPDIHIGNAAAIAAYSAPQDLVFVIGRIGSDYVKNVRQDHRGAIIMPPISNVVDIQTQLP